MELNKQQQKGLDIACERFKKGLKYSVIAGYA